MSATRDMNHEQVVESLREWAKGSLPLQAAVEFLAETVTFTGRHSMIGIDNEGLMYERFYLDLSRLDVDEDLWAKRTMYMSGGERATWELARSLVNGELERHFWRLDGQRKRAFIAALIGNV